MANGPSFTRVGLVRVPVSGNSANSQFSMPASLMGRPDLTFMFVNPNPFDIRLEGTLKDQAFNPVTSSTGWLVLARTTMGPFTSKMPVMLSAQAYATLGAPLPSDFTGAVLELVYGRGD